MSWHSVHGRRASRLWLFASAAMIVVVLAIWTYLPGDEIRPAIGIRTPSQTNEVYRLIWNGRITPAAGGAIVAQVDGLFAREGLTIALDRANDDMSLAAAVAADDHVFGHISASTFLRARAAGSPIVAFAAARITSSVEFYALSITALHSPLDLVGKKVGYMPDSDIGASVEALIRKQMLPRSLITVADTKLSVDDLLHQRIDVLAGYSEVEGEKLRSLKIPFNVISLAAFGIHSIGTVYITSEQALARQPDLAERFLAALIQGWEAAYANLDRTIPIITQAMDSDAAPAGVLEFMDRQRTYIRPFGVRVGEHDLARWRELQERLLAQRFMSQAVDLRQSVLFSVVPELYRTRLKSLATH